LLAWELVMLLWKVRQGRGWDWAAAVAVAVLLAGPVTLVAAGLAWAMSPSDSRRQMLGLALRGTAIGIGGVALLWWGAVGAVMVVGALAVAWALRAYRRTTSPLPARRKALLLGLRLAIIAALVLWALGPTLEIQRRLETRKVLLVGLDASASMQRRDVDAQTLAAATDESGRTSRWQALRDAMLDAEGHFKHLSRSADLQFFLFDTEPRPIDTGDDDWLWSLGDAEGQATAIGDAVVEAGEGLQGGSRELAGVVVCSDGSANVKRRLSEMQMASLMASRGVAVHAVGIGSDQPVGSAAMLSVRQLNCPDEVEAFNRLAVSAVIEAHGLAGRQVEVECFFGDQRVGSEVLQIAGATARPVADFAHVPLESGYHRLRVTARLLGAPPPELSGQPEAHKLVRVVDRELRVLYVEGRVRYESKFIAQALVAGRRFSVDRRIIQAQAQGQLGQRLEDWLGYHVIILGDIGPEHFSDAQQEIIKRLVGDFGKGLAMIGGPDSFGRWRGTPVADVLGVDVTRSQRDLGRAVKVVPTIEGRESDLMRIDPDASVEAAWTRLRPLAGAQQLGPPKPAATVLAQSEQGEPLIVVQPYGRGRSAAVAFDTTWRWVLSPDDTAELQKRFWRQLALYLAAPKGNAWILTDRTGYDLRQVGSGSQRIEVSAGVEDTSGRPLTDVEIEVTLTDPDGNSAPLQLARHETGWSGSLGALKNPGIYKLGLTTEVEGKPMTAEHQFELVQRDLESLDMLANLDLLRDVAERSGGTYAPLNELKELLDRIEPQCRPAVRVELLHSDLRDVLRWPVALALVCLMCVEWASRKRRGLV
jgi:uncharacterized membrane protein